MFTVVRQLRDWYRAVRRIRQKYRQTHGRALALFRPHRFTEKIQWRKLFDLDPIYAIFCDKLAVRDYIAMRVGTELLLPLLWTGTDPGDLPFDDLDPPYVIKSTHASGHTLIVGARDGLDVAQARETMRGWLSQDYGASADEPGYTPVPRCLMVERQVFGPNGERPLERRMFVFGGRVRIINTIVVIDDAVRNGAFHTPDWRRQNWILNSPLLPRQFARPERLDDLIAAAERVAEGLEHVRVDFYDCGQRIYIGEITCYSWSGMAQFGTDEADQTLGSYWKIRAPMTRAAVTMLSRPRKIVPQPQSEPGQRLARAAAPELEHPRPRVR